MSVPKKAKWCPLGNTIVTHVPFVMLQCAYTANRLVHVPIFGGLSGSEDRGGGDSSIQFINIGRVGDKSFKE